MLATMTQGDMAVAQFASGKGHEDENFPVASFLVHSRHRAVILAFYRFARVADDVTDHPHADAATKLKLLGEMRASLKGECDVAAEACALRDVLRTRGLSIVHALDLLEAFSRDVTKLRYANWDDLMDYCRYSAMPVGRFVLDVHGETASTWPANDALCAGLQVINHLQDCAKDYHALNRVYIPQDVLAAAGLTVAALDAPKAGPALQGVIRSLAQRTGELIASAKPFASQIRDTRLALEVSVIQRLAEDLVAGLIRRDPLSECVHHRRSETLVLAASAIARFIPSLPRRLLSSSRRETIRP
jgi:hydroxysqualene synthase